MAQVVRLRIPNLRPDDVDSAALIPIPKGKTEQLRTALLRSWSVGRRAGRVATAPCSRLRPARIVALEGDAGNGPLLVEEWLSVHFSGLNLPPASGPSTTLPAGTGVSADGGRAGGAAEVLGGLARQCRDVPDRA